MADDGEYRGVPGYSLYRVAPSGRVQSRAKGKWEDLSGCRTRKGYRQYTLKGDDGELRTLLQHELVMRTWVGPLPAGCEVGYRDGDVENCVLGNLYYGSRAGDDEHPRWLTRNRGERNRLAKLTEAKVREIREEVRGREGGLERGELTRLARKYGVNRGTISYVVRGERWRHVV